MATSYGTWQKLATSNSTSSSFTAANLAPCAYASLPSTNMITVPEVVGSVPDQLMLMFFGAGSNDTTFDVRIIGWRESADQVTYIATPLAVLTCTLSATVGATGLMIGASDRLVDTYALGTGFNAGVIIDVTSPTSDIPGHILLDHRGFRKFQIDFDMTGATSGNAIYTYLASKPVV